MDIRKTLETRIATALTSVGAPANSDAVVHPASRPEFGDYQADGVMRASKILKTNPRQLATNVVGKLDLTDLAKKVEIAGPGFINITLKNDIIADHLHKALTGDHLAINITKSPQTIIVDYSGPNLAKEMHVGHLRSTIIGDALARILEFTGHNVIRQNHVGDFGAQFGMLIAHMDELPDTDNTQLRLSDLEEFYRQAKNKFDTDLAFADTARQYVVKLQNGDEHCADNWRRYVDVSLTHCDEVYKRLDLSLADKHMRPESSYKNDFAQIIEQLASKNLLTKSDGAQCVFIKEFQGKEDKPLPFIVQKSDGAYLYSTFDLAALKYRVNSLNADRILYVHDSRQSLHFKQAFATARLTDIVPDNILLEHIAFGTMLGNDRRPFKTRAGGTVKLMDLLDEAEQRAFNLIADRSTNLSEDKRRHIAHAVGIGAIKYADLSLNRTTDYIFDWERMLSFEGNTAPYMQYAYARIQSIFRKAEHDQNTSATRVDIIEPAERQLAVKLVQFGETIHTVANDCYPNLLCNYLFELAGNFMRFYESCPVMTTTDTIKASRLSLCQLTANTIKSGLDLLGIKTVEQM